MLKKRVVWIGATVIVLGLAWVVVRVPGATDARYNAVVASGTVPPGEHASRLHRSLVIADLHADAL